jgi:hypothetical protein
MCAGFGLDAMDRDDRGDLPDEYERREHDTAAAAWSDYWGRILELEGRDAASPAAVVTPRQHRPRR